MWLVGMGGDSRMCFGISKSFATLQYLVAGAYYINSDILVVYAESLSMPPPAVPSILPTHFPSPAVVRLLCPLLLLSTLVRRTEF